MDNKRNIFLRMWDIISGIFQEEDANDDAGYDPAHVGAMVVIVIFVIAILFWSLWSLLVFKGGLFEKIAPFFQLVFTKKTLVDFGYEGWHDQGIFNGWVTNLVSLLFLCFLCWIVNSIFKKVKD